MAIEFKHAILLKQISKVVFVLFKESKSRRFLRSGVSKRWRNSQTQYENVKMYTPLNLKHTTKQLKHGSIVYYRIYPYELPVESPQIAHEAESDNTLGTVL